MLEKRSYNILTWIYYLSMNISTKKIFTVLFFVCIVKQIKRETNLFSCFLIITSLISWLWRFYDCFTCTFRLKGLRNMNSKDQYNNGLTKSRLAHWLKMKISDTKLADLTLLGSRRSDCATLQDYLCMS